MVSCTGAPAHRCSPAVPCARKALHEPAPCPCSVHLGSKRCSARGDGLACRCLGAARLNPEHGRARCTDTSTCTLSHRQSLACGSASRRGAVGRRRQGRRGGADAGPAPAQEDLKTQHFLWQLLCIEGDARRARAEAARCAAEAEAAGAGLAGAEREAAAKRREAAGFAKERAVLERQLAARRAEVEKKVRAHAPPVPAPSSLQRRQEGRCGCC
jgi:hypothetical protein